MMLNDNHFADVSKMIETPPLTAELSSNPLQLMLEWLCDNGGLDYLSITPEDIAEAASDIAKSYAAQQTAAKDARIAELEHLLAVRMSNAARKIEDIKQAHRCRDEDVSMKLYNTKAERDALQTKLDDALAQVAMVRGALGNLYWVVTCSGMSDALARLGNPCNAYVKNASQILEQTQPTAEQWLVDRDAALLKPWREAVTVLREACELDPTRFPLMEEKAVMLAIRYNTDPVTILEDFSELTYEALKATEDLQ